MNRDGQLQLCVGVNSGDDAFFGWSGTWSSILKRWSVVR